MLLGKDRLRHRLAVAGVFVVSVLALGAVDANDLNIEAAKAKYDAQKAISDRAAARYEDYKRVFSDAENRYLAAVSRLKSAESNVTGWRNEVDRIERDLRSAEDEVPRYQSQISSLRDEKNRIQSQLDRLRRDEDSAERDLQKARQAHRRAEDELADERRKPKPDPDRVRHLEERVNQAQQAVNRELNQLQRVRDEVRTQEARLRSNDDEILAVDRKLEELRTRIARLGRERDDARDRLADARVAVERVRGEVTNLSGQVDAARTELGLREAEYRREYAITQAVWSDYQAVLANYNREKDRILRVAADLAGVDGYREGIERGNPDGAAAGQKNALDTAAAVGATQGKARDRARGYRDGREKAKTDAALAVAYSTGTASGKAIANRKAEGEAYPKGYAAELDAHFAGAPANVATIDMANVPADAGTNAPILSLEKPPVRPVTAPTYPLPAVPGAAVPVAPQVSVSAPDPDNRYYAEPCDNLVRPEFGPLCKARYAEVYGAASKQGYAAGYRERFKEAFEKTVGPAHAAAFAVEQAAEFATGRSEGARDQGVLEGFAEVLPGALVQQEAAGREAWKKLQAAGVLVRSVSSNLVDDDGLFAGDETLALELVLDNYGGQATAKDGLVLKTKRVEGLTAVSTDPVKLPALAGNTRTTLKNVLGLKVNAAPAGTHVSFEGTVERPDGVAVAAVKVEAKVAYPVEIVSLVVPKGAKLGQKTDVKVTLRNRRAFATKEAALTMSAEGTVTFGEEPVKVPSIGVDGTAEVTVPMTPTYWVGGNVQTSFTATLVEAEARFTQIFGAVFPVERNGSLHLIDRNGNPIPSGKLVVQSNAVNSVLVRLNNETTAFSPGPFGLKAIQQSDPALVIPSNNTISVQYGALSPGTSWGAQAFNYFVPAALKGKRAWVQIGAYEGSNWIHVMQVELEVK